MMTKNIGVGMEWQYLFLVAISVGLSFYWINLPQPYISIEHAVLALFGVIFTASVFIASTLVFSEENKTKVSRLNIANFLTSAALTSLILGIPVIKGVQIILYLPPIEVIFIGITIEESYRIAMYHLVKGGFGSSAFAAIVSGLVFAAIHIHWQPTAWLFAFVGGIVFSVGLGLFMSQTACVLSHFMYDLLAFGIIGIPLYFGIFILMLIFGLIPNIKRYSNLKTVAI